MILLFAQQVVAIPQVRSRSKNFYKLRALGLHSWPKIKHAEHKDHMDHIIAPPLLLLCLPLHLTQILSTFLLRPPNWLTSFHTHSFWLAVAKQ